MITIVDYGLGNILAFVNVYKKLNIRVSVAQTPADLKAAQKIILPGVGAFDHAMELLDRSGMRSTLDELAMDKRVPVLGICVGMQILAESSDEGKLPGLKWISGRVRRLHPDEGSKLPLPHMGWNDVHPVASNSLFDQLQTEAQFYFLHSYYLECDRAEDVLATSFYGTEFSCAINSKNIFGVQFHPEKSHHYGTRLLKNFAESSNA
jgi:imidazole glycerol-phosphate synthase subunit HisH